MLGRKGKNMTVFKNSTQSSGEAYRAKAAADESNKQPRLIGRAASTIFTALGTAFLTVGGADKIVVGDMTSAGLDLVVGGAFLGAGYLMNKDKIEVIPLGVNFSKFSLSTEKKIDFLQKYNLPDNAVILSFIASFKPSKARLF